MVFSHILSAHKHAYGHVKDAKKIHHVNITTPSEEYTLERYQEVHYTSFRAQHTLPFDLKTNTENTPIVSTY